ncbi:MAG: isoamylase early set domain-containing protein [Desulfobulbaceae bacterium]|nr:isoamylase early set domain-containing protein [Desulfobulbaceae bacterium]
MLKKNYTKNSNTCRVTFKHPNTEKNNHAVLIGDFNDWDTETQPMKQLKDGSFSLTVSLEANRDYRFRYLLDGNIWDNDPEADNYLANNFGSDDSIVSL